MRTFRQVGNYSLVRFPDADMSVIQDKVHPASKITYSHAIDDKEHDIVINLSDDEFTAYCEKIIETTERIEKKNNDLANKIADTLNISIVTCGHCGTVNLHEMDKDVECEGCGREMEPCDCPDLFYEK